VTGSGDHSARVWDAQTGQPLTKPMKHDDGVYSVQFSPDGKRIVTGSRDHTARVWDAQTGQALSEARKHDDGVGSAQFSPDNRRSVTGSRDHTARVFDLVPVGEHVPGWLLELADAIVGQRLNSRGGLEPLAEDPIKMFSRIKSALSAAPVNDDWV